MTGFPLTAHDLARALGGKVTGRNSVNAPGPGHSGRDRSMSIKIEDGAPEGFIVFPHAGDDPLACRDHIRRMAGLPDWQPSKAAAGDGVSSIFIDRMSARAGARQPDQAAIAAEKGDQRQRTAWAMDAWQQAGTISGTLVQTYIEARGLILPEAVIRGGAVRFHPRCTFKGEDGQKLRLPAMVCLMTNALTGVAQAIHRTALKADGSGKEDLPNLGDPKKMLGPAKGAIIRLCPDEDVSGALGVTEGVENAIAVICSGWAPTWAAGTAGAVESLPVLPGVESLTVFGDLGQAGEKAAKMCCQRWAEEGREAVTRFPKSGDWNDIQKGKSA